MATVWRLAPTIHARSLDGEGNRIMGARWNSPGHGVVYTCANLSLAVLEAYVHIPGSLRLNLPDFEAVRLSIPDDAGATQISVEELEAMLTAADPHAACRAAGDRWIAAGRDLVLAAPSIIVPEELNLMLNPAHRRMHDVAIVSTRRFQFDTRLFAPAR
jgi:RES domain-containing protein